MLIRLAETIDYKSIAAKNSVAVKSSKEMNSPALRGKVTPLRPRD